MNDTVWLIRSMRSDHANHSSPRWASTPARCCAPCAARSYCLTLAGQAGIDLQRLSPALMDALMLRARCEK